jgi:hypothetical protein
MNEFPKLRDSINSLLALGQQLVDTQKWKLITKDTRSIRACLPLATLAILQSVMRTFSNSNFQMSKKKPLDMIKEFLSRTF